MRTLQQQAVAASGIDQDGEFIPAQPRDNIVRPNLVLEPCRDLSQQSIAEHMTACVVDGFEVVEIDIEKCRIEYGRGILPFLLAQPLVEKMAIGQTCQAVIMSHESDTLFNLPRASYVPRHTGHTVATFARARGKPPIAKL